MKTAFEISLLLGPVLLIAHFYLTGKLVEKSIQSTVNEYIVYPLWFLGLLLIWHYLANGIEGSLIIVPAGWGAVNDDGEFISTRYCLARALSALSVVMYGYAITRSEKYGSTLRQKADTH